MLIQLVDFLWRILSAVFRNSLGSKLATISFVQNDRFFSKMFIAKVSSVFLFRSISHPIILSVVLTNIQVYSLEF